MKRFWSKTLISTSILFFCEFNHAQNPISPEGIFLADPSARVWADNKIYIYGSVDKKPTEFCSNEYHILSSQDMINWSLHKSTFIVDGKNDKVLYNTNNTLYAPDCYTKNGLYYLYYCQPDDIAEGVAIANSPMGPFQNGEKIKLFGHNEIDPSAFIDTDNKPYYMWGQFNMKIAKLKDNMKEIDSSSIISNLITEKQHFFHEGSFMAKRNGMYYIIYSHAGRKDKPSCLGYATSKNIMGPFKYRGVIIDNEGCDPNNWNNHGSIAAFNNQWYVFYHRTTNGSISMRKACVEPIYFNEDGTIDEVEMTSQGAGKPLDAFKPIEARTACLVNGKCKITLDTTNQNEYLGSIFPSDYAVYKYIDFGAGADSISVKVKLTDREGGFNLQIDKSWGQWLGYVHFPERKSKQEFEIINAKIRPVKGVHAVYFKFYGKNEKSEGFVIDSFTFFKSKTK
ncbi:MAG: carbohydrate-binding protein [Cytophagales bacterium]|nr:MAG: carbohydrate-binding protein [Cytophagales bacterium]